MTRVAILLALALVLPAAHAQQPQQQPSAEAESKPPVYVPPQRGAPSRRVGGSSRGAGDNLPTVMVLVPDHVGLTATDSPALYWYISKPTAVRIEVTLVDDRGEAPLIEYAVAKADGPGVHRIDLGKRAVHLKAGIEYQWSVAVVPNPNERSNDVMAGGVLMRVDEPAPVAARRKAGASKQELARLLAAEGIWYDSIALYSELIEAQPSDRKLRAARAALLDQVGLKEVAEFDRRAAAQP